MTAERPDNGADNNLHWLLDAVTEIDSNASDAVLIDRIAALERLKSAAAAAQARLTATFTDSMTADAEARHHRPDAVRRSIAGQVGLARRDSPHAGRRHVGVAAALVGDMPCTLAALSCGDLSERRARIIVEQLACLTPADRREADQLLAPELPGLGDRSAETRAAAMAYRLDPEAVMAKVRGAVKDRHVGLRPAPDAMGRLSALLPVTLAVAVYAALNKAAIAATAAPGGDPRNHGQLMADALVSAVTGQHITGCDDYGVPHYGPADRATSADTAATSDTAAASHNTAHTDAASLNAADTAATSDTAAATQNTAHTDAASPNAADTGHNASDNDAAGPNAVDTDTVEGTSAAEGAVTDTTFITDVSAAPIEPVTGPAAPSGPTSTAVAVRSCTGGCGLSINLVMTDRTLLDGDDEPAHLTGFGPIPAALARALVIGAADTDTRTWIRRLYTDPVTGQLTQMDSRRRLFPPAAKRFLLARDQTCRTPWCDAPIREYDHVQPHADGGATTIHNAQGVCKACNLTTQAPRWFFTADDGTIRFTVPTGHSYSSTAPPPPRSTPWADISHNEHRLAKTLLWSATA